MELSQKPENTHESYRMAWTAYIRSLIVFAVIVFVGLIFYGNGAPKIGIGIWIFALGLLVMHILSIRSVVLYTDDDGVWVFSGVFPWSRGVNGVKWRDLDDATYISGFWSWLFKSYTVRIGHRFTKSSEIILTHIAHGNVAVEHINTFHRQSLDVDERSK